MKFLCDNCKAKYQIADEKVAGKTVRMKCRKCGHQIEVRAAVTETSASVATSAAPPPPTRAPFAASPQAPAPRAPMPARPLATSLSQAKPKAPSAPMGSEARGGGGLMGGGALAGAFQRNLSDTPDSVLPTDAGAAPIELSVTDEWYVAINGVPVGPVRISELRRKAATGAVTEESLCWQEGLEEWRPIRSIPELAALVREAAHGGHRPSMTSSPELPPSARSPSLPAAPRTAAPPPTTPNFDATAAMAMPPGVLSAPPARPMTSSAPTTGRNNVVPFRPATASDGGRASEDFGLGLGASAAAPSLAPPQPMMFSQAPAPQTSPHAPPVTVPSPVADPFAVPPGPSAGPNSAALNAPPYRESFVPPVAAAPSAMQQPPPRSIPLWFWPVLLLALGFGGGLAFVVFKPQAPPAPIVIQPPTTSTTPAPTAAPVDKGDIPPPTPAATDTVTAANDPPGTKPKAGGSKVATTTAKPAATEEPKKGLDLGGLVPGAGGPNVNAGGGPGAGGGGGLDQAGVERVVAAHRAGVKRTCWERGAADQKSSVNVTINATVAGNGSVATTSSSGDDPVVAKCIENQVKTWMFSAPGSSQQIAIPFKFVRQ